MCTGRRRCDYEGNMSSSGAPEEEGCPDARSNKTATTTSIGLIMFHLIFFYC